MIAHKYHINFKTIGLAITLSILILGNCFSQNQKDIRKLKNEFTVSIADTTKIRLATEISTRYRNLLENDSSKKYASTALSLLTKLPNKHLQSIPNFKVFKAKSIENIGSALTYENTDLALDTMQKSIALWKEVNDKDGLAMAYFSLGQIYSFKGNYLKALDTYYESIKLSEETGNKQLASLTWYELSLEKRYLGNYGDALESSITAMKIAKTIKDTTLITNALLGNSFNYLLAEKYDLALKEQREAMRLYKLSKDTLGIARAYNDLGVTYFYSGNLDKSLINHQKALKLRKQMQDLNGVGISLNYLSLIYRKQGNMDKALSFINESIINSEKFGDNRFIFQAYLDAGDIQLEMKNYEKAIAAFNKAADISKKDNSKSNLASALLKIGEVYLKSGQQEKAIVSLQNAEQVVLPEDFKIRRFIYELKQETYASSGDFKNAYASQLKYQQINDSVSATEKSEKIAALTQQLIYENQSALQKASQDKEIAIKESQINEQKLWRNISITGLLLGLVFTFIFFTRFKEKRKMNVALENSLTNLKATQAQLIQSEKMASLGELTAGIAHEIQNPLNFVTNFSEVSNELIDEMKLEIDNGEIEEAKFISEDIKQNLNKIIHHSKRAETIVKEMLVHSRTSGGIKEPTDINKLTDEYLKLAYHGLRAKDKSFNARLETDYDQSIGKIDVIPQDIGRVILNLVTNAFYACSERLALSEAGMSQSNSHIPDAGDERFKKSDYIYKPRVKVSTKLIHYLGSENGGLSISVKDNGNGIPKHVLDKIFQPFFTTKPAGRGTGLGLSMSYDIITKGHGGELTLETKEGKDLPQEETGTIFNIILPIDKNTTSNNPVI